MQHKIEHTPDIYSCIHILTLKLGAFLNEQILYHFIMCLTSMKINFVNVVLDTLQHDSVFLVVVFFFKI